MAATDMEVTIRLTPLGHDEVAENHRVITLNHDKKEVEIGRASKNAHKGLLASSDNAWFDYPILSRSHAKFIMSPSQKEIFVQDCNSTHGTYLNKQKLAKGVEYAVADGETITFGQRVTSGAITYPAKEFRFGSKWDSQIRASVARLFDAAPAYTYKVPEDFDDSSSEPSREGSIQIIESNPRTFSVPSSDGESDSEDDDGESVQIASSVLDDGEQESAATTPDHRAAREESVVDLENESVVTGGKVFGPNLKGPRILDLLTKTTTTGTTQQDPIDLEGDCARKQNIPNTESDDEGPEILSIHEASSRTDKTPLWTEPQLARPQYHLPTVTDEKVDLETPPPDLVFETQATQARISKDKGKEADRDPSPELAIGSIAGATDGFNSADDDGFDDDDDFSSCGREEETVSSFNKLTTSGSASGSGSGYPMIPKPTWRSGAKAPQPPYKDPAMQIPSSSRPPLFSMNMSEPIDVSQSAYPNFQPSTTQRAPSPSDAALAKMSSDPSNYKIQSAGFEIHRVFNPNVHYTPTGIPHDSVQEAVDNHPFGYQYVEPTYQELPTTDTDTHSKPYDQGPFSSRGETGAPRSTTPWPFGDDSFDRPDFHSWEPVKSSGSESGVASCYQNIDEDARYAAKLQAEEDAYAAAARTPIKKIYQPPKLSSELRRGGEGHSSKINIASLVNNSCAENPKSLKRKAEELSTTNETEEIFTVPTTVSSTKSQVVDDDRNNEQETQLPDAQVRDVFPLAEAAPLSQDNESAPIVGSASIATNAEAVKTEESARKKVRTSSSSSGGIGKFVSGVCVGLVGAFAAFVATIPASVREEALREIANSA